MRRACSFPFTDRRDGGGPRHGASIVQAVRFADGLGKHCLWRRAEARPLHRPPGRARGRHHLAVDPDARVADLSVGVRQRIEILKALHRDARILILDKPTAVLTPPARDALFAVLKSLPPDGRPVLFVTHKLHEVTAITDRITILRDGRTVVSLRTADTDAGEIVRAMTGRNINVTVEKRQAQPGEALLKSVDVTIASPSGKRVVDG